MGVDSWPVGGPMFHSAADGTRPGRSDVSSASDYYTTAPAHTPRSNGRVPPTTGVPVTRPGRPAASPRHRVQRAGPSRRRGGPLGDHRGLTAAGALVLLLAFGGVGAGIDRLLGHDLSIFFSIAFVAAVLLNAFRIHLEDLAASILMVPIAFAAVGAGSTLIAELGSGSGLKQQAVTAAGVLVFGAPILLLAVLVAAVVALSRGRAATLARRRARARAARRYGNLPPGSRPRRRSRVPATTRRGH